LKKERYQVANRRPSVVPMHPADAARVVHRAARIAQALTDRLNREVDRLNQRPVQVFTQKERTRIATEMRVPRVVARENAKPLGRPRKAETEKAEA
jgi:hypothetical protein